MVGKEKEGRKTQNQNRKVKRFRRPCNSLLLSPASHCRSLCLASLSVPSRGIVGRREIGSHSPKKMADAFGDELFSVFEEDSTTAAGPKKDKEKEKGKWKGLPGSADKDG